ncbi:coatomer subunit delta isoform X3 [Arachis hypogaea]|uniref:coatomer subunit delta isoform X3 n=2 Tax=Arachis hypogaea TaxID=3818 RepID=UPI000DECC54C|nr:coatomer subunit delta isoform X2 [Arachis hypogaea]
MNMHQKMRLTLFYHHMLLSRSKKVQPSLFRQHFMRLMFFHTLLRVTLQLVSLLDMCNVPEYSDYFEESICKCAFDLILISLGHKENVTVTQVKQYCEMESHEEKLHRQMREDKIREAKDEMKRKANEIDKNKIIKNRGDNYKGGFGPLQSMGSGIFENSFNDTSISSSGTGSRLSSDVDSFSTKSKDRI